MYLMLCMVFHLILQLSHNSEGRSFNVTLDELGVGNTKNYVLNDTVIYIIEIRNISDVIERVPPRIYVKCEDCTEDHPILVVVSQNKGVLSWELPLVIKSENYHGIYKNVERTLCPYDIKNMISEENITHPVTIALSTSNYLSKNIELLVNLEENFVLGIDENKTVQITPSTPAFYLFEFPPENVTSILLEVNSNDDICLILSVQNVSCPVFDLEENIGYRGHFQTVTRKGGHMLTKEDFPNGFYLVLVVSGEDKYCSSMLLNSFPNRSKNVVITVSKNISVQDYKLAVCLTIFVTALFCIIMFVIFFFSMKKQKEALAESDDECLFKEFEPSTSNEQAPQHIVKRKISGFHMKKMSAIALMKPLMDKSPVLTALQAFLCVSETSETFLGSTTPSTHAPNTDSLSLRTDSSLDETDFDMINDAELDKNIFRMKSFLYLCDLSRKNQTILKKKSELYFRSLITVAIFYFLPVIQLAFSDQYRFNQSGKEDLCYYNVLCSHPLWWFSDFNHIFSNIGYIAFGILFMFLTVVKERLYKQKICDNEILYKFYGIPQHFGLFYAMGAALIVEGVLSSCYHTCPNHYNFQFDSSFMYVICTLCMVKIYQTRHPDISASAYTTFSVLAGVIFIGMCGVFSSNLTFWIIFTIAHLSTCIYVSLQIYYMGRWKWEFIRFVRWFNELQPCCSCNLRFFSPMFPSRFILLLAANICNWGLAVGSFLFELKNFSSYLLTIFMVNLVLYTAFYILMKFICKERLPLQSVIYILLAMLCWTAALYFFFNKTISWRLTPAESKLFNQKCILLDFYDNHDVWHFISAAAMFFSFMVLLTFDDDLVHVHRSNIVVF